MVDLCDDDVIVVEMCCMLSDDEFIVWLCVQVVVILGWGWCEYVDEFWLYVEFDELMVG